MAMFPGLGEALARARVEGAKVEGTAVMTTMTVDTIKSPEQMTKESEQPQDSGGGGLGGMLARKMAKKKQPESDAGPANRANVMTTTHELLSVSTDVPLIPPTVTGRDRPVRRFGCSESQAARSSGNGRMLRRSSQAFCPSIALPGASMMNESPLDGTSICCSCTTTASGTSPNWLRSRKVEACHPSSTVKDSDGPNSTAE